MIFSNKFDLFWTTTFSLQNTRTTLYETYSLVISRTSACGGAWTRTFDLGIMWRVLNHCATPAAKH
jgi:hypothetical protein